MAGERYGLGYCEKQSLTVILSGLGEQSGFTVAEGRHDSRGAQSLAFRTNGDVCDRDVIFYLTLRRFASQKETNHVCMAALSEAV